MEELSTFLNTTVGVGGSDVDDDVDSESGYAFDLGFEWGVRYKYASGLFLSASIISCKSNYGATDSHNNVTFHGLDDDFTGLAFSVGMFF